MCGGGSAKVFRIDIAELNNGRRSGGPVHPNRAHGRLWCKEQSSRLQVIPGKKHRRMSHIHLSGNGNVMGRAGLGKILAILRHGGKARDGQQKGANYKPREKDLGELCDGVEYSGF